MPQEASSGHSPEVMDAARPLTPHSLSAWSLAEGQQRPATGGVRWWVHRPSGAKAEVGGGASEGASHSEMARQPGWALGTWPSAGAGPRRTAPPHPPPQPSGPRPPGAPAPGKPERPAGSWSLCQQRLELEQGCPGLGGGDPGWGNAVLSAPPAEDSVCPARTPRHPGERRGPIRQPHWAGVGEASASPSPVSSVLPAPELAHSQVTCVLVLSQVNELAHTGLPTPSQAQLPLRLVAGEQAGVWGPGGRARSQHQGQAPPLGRETWSHPDDTFRKSLKSRPWPLGTDCPQSVTSELGYSQEPSGGCSQDRETEDTSWRQHVTLGHDAHRN